MRRATAAPQSIRTVAAAVALTGLAGLALAGCGGSSSAPMSKAAYEAAVAKIDRELDADIAPVYKATTPRAAGAALQSAQSTFGVAERQLAALAPPASFKTGNTRLARALTQYIAALSPVIRSLDTGNSASMASITSIKAFSALRSAQQAVIASR